MIEELGMFLLLMLTMGVIFTALIAGKAVVWLWRFVADYRGETKRIEELRWSNIRTFEAYAKKEISEHDLRIKHLDKRMGQVEKALYPGPSKPLDGIPKDVPRAPEVET